MDMGWTLIRPVSRLILAFFVFVHRFIPNYGLVIIIFSIILKIIFYPLTHKQLEATRKMQQLQPQLAALKEKYKNDPQRLNKETMALYKKGGANPLGGCFPLLLQMPIFFALFSVFRSTIELRRAEFFLWIKDLSVKDPYLVLPIVMAVTMFIQQKMTVKDPKQAAMVYLMPAIMFFFFMNFASGLVLYWTVFNILSIIQQVFVERKGTVVDKK
jgi:YidC/Oxa1 family membrane protein insertase